MNAEQIQNIIDAEQIKDLSTQLNITRGERDRLHEEIALLRKENEELKSQRPRYTCPQDEDLTGGDANYEYYYTNTDDGEMTIWKVPRHLAEIKSSTPNNWDNAVAECFRDEKFGENWDKLNYLIVREMKLKDLVKRKWKPAAEKPKEEEEAQAEQAFFEGKEGGVIRWKPEGEEEEEEEWDDEAYRALIAEKQRSELEAWRQDFRDGKFEPKEKDDLCGCAECEKCPSHINPYEWAEATHGDEDEEEEYDPLVMRGEDCDGYKCGNKLTTEEECRRVMCESCINIWKGFEKDGVPCELRHDLGAAIYAARNASEDEEELNSEDDDYEDKMEGKWKCRRCGENKASSVVFKGGDCLNYCRECLDELEENSEIEKGGDAANYQYKWM